MKFHVRSVYVDAWHNKWAHSPFNAGRHRGGFTVLWRSFVLDVRRIRRDDSSYTPGVMGPPPWK